MGIPNEPFEEALNRLWQFLNQVALVFYPSALPTIIGIWFLPNVLFALPLIFLVIFTGGYLAWQWTDCEFLIESAENPHNWLTNQPTTKRIISLLKSERIPLKTVANFRRIFYRGTQMLIDNFGENTVRFEFIEITQICFMREYTLDFETARTRASKEFEAFARGEYPNP